MAQGRPARYGFSAANTPPCSAACATPAGDSRSTPTACFSAGHSMGGDAAWDIGLAHPDLWAGVIPIVAQAEKFCSQYWQNAKFVPFYFVAGELDGDKPSSNAEDLDRYMASRYDITVVEYQGRGHEDFYEEIQNLFDWMARRPARNFFPEEFEVSTMRTWDNYFWWLEVNKLPPRSMVGTEQLAPPRSTRAADLSHGTVQANGESSSPAPASRRRFGSRPRLAPARREIDLSVAAGTPSTCGRPERRCWTTSAPAATGCTRSGRRSRCPPTASTWRTGNSNGSVHRSSRHTAYSCLCEQLRNRLVHPARSSPAGSSACNIPGDGQCPRRGRNWPRHRRA